MRLSHWNIYTFQQPRILLRRRSHVRIVLGRPNPSKTIRIKQGKFSKPLAKSCSYPFLTINWPFFLTKLRCYWPACWRGAPQIRFTSSMLWPRIQLIPEGIKPLQSTSNPPWPKKRRGMVSFGFIEINIIFRCNFSYKIFVRIRKKGVRFIINPSLIFKSCAVTNNLIWVHSIFAVTKLVVCACQIYNSRDFIWIVRCVICTDDSTSGVPNKKNFR